jgi:hypothetical protein
VELLSIILPYEGNCLGVEHIMSDKVIIWASWSDRPLIRGSAEKLNLLISIKMLSMSVFEFIKFLVGNLIVLNKLKEAMRDSKRVTLEVVSRKFTLKSPHTIMFVDTLYNLFKTNSR